MIDISGWGEFRITDLFEKPVNVANVLKKDIIEDSGSTPYVTASSKNNGVVTFIDATCFDVIHGRCILVGGKTCSMTYQAIDFVSNDSHNFVLRLKGDRTENHYLFILSILKNHFQRLFSWGDAITANRIINTAVKLPVAQSGEPDWCYMESYMKQVVDRAERDLDRLQSSNGTKHLVDVTQWGEFSIISLFDLSLPKGDLQVKKVEDGAVPLITPSKYNNGRLKMVSRNSPSTLFQKGALTVDMFGNAYYQEEVFFVTAHGHVNVLLPKKTVNVYCGSFLASAIRAMFLDKYGFDEMCTLKVLQKESIKLPVTSSGEPDWQYMESYMKQTMDEAGRAVSALMCGV